jgi:hypothetical protein
MPHVVPAEIFHSGTHRHLAEALGPHGGLGRALAGKQA